jgi:hypothetical protein
MRKHVVALGSLVLVASLTVYLAWTHMDYVDATTHDTTRWAVLQDVEGSVIAVEPADDAVWQQLSASMKRLLLRLNVVFKKSMVFSIPFFVFSQSPCTVSASNDLMMIFLKLCLSDTAARQRTKKSKSK